MIALDWVYRNAGLLQIAAVNLSLGGGAAAMYCDDEPIKAHIDALRRIGVATVVAAGNDDDPTHVGYPACVSSAIAVGAVTASDQDSVYTNRWALPMLLAPGDAILSSLPGGRYGVLSGTSMATPHVAGGFALLQSALGGPDVEHILAALGSTGKPILDAATGMVRPRIDLAEAFAQLGGGVRPETGWWWNPDEPGTGLFLEVAGGQAYVSLFSYGGDGRAIWYVSPGPMPSARLYEGLLLLCGGGNPAGGAAPCSAVGRIALQFESATKASLLISDGSRIPLERYRF